MARRKTNTEEGIYDIAAERALISSLLFAPDKVMDVYRIIKPEDFFTSWLSKIYVTILGLHQEGKLRDKKGKKLERLSQVFMFDALRDKGFLDESVDGNVSLTALTELYSEPDTAPQQMEGFAEIVKKMSLNRKAQRTAAHLGNAALDPTSDTYREVLLTIKHLQDITNWYNSGAEVRYMRTSDESIEIYENIIKGNSEEVDLWDADTEKKESKRLIPIWGLSGWDGDIENGIMPEVLIRDSELYGLLSDTGGGKSTMANTILRANRKIGRKVLFASAELSLDTLDYRLIASLSGVSYNKIYLYFHSGYKHMLSRGELENIQEALDIIKTWPGKSLNVNISGWDGVRTKQEFLRMDDMEQSINGRGFDVILVDYLQAMKLDARNVGNGRDDISVGENVISLREIAMELKIPVIMFSQVTGGREGGNRGERIKPGLHSGARSSQIEHSCQTMIGLWRSKLEPEKPAVIYIIKSNNDTDIKEEHAIELLPGEFVFQSKF